MVCRGDAELFARISNNLYPKIYQDRTFTPWFYQGFLCYPLKHQTVSVVEHQHPVKSCHILKLQAVLHPLVVIMKVT